LLSEEQHADSFLRVVLKPIVYVENIACKDLCLRTTLNNLTLSSDPSSPAAPAWDELPDLPATDTEEDAGEVGLVLTFKVFVIQ